MAPEFRPHEMANNQVTLSYLDNHGDGPVVVALHGLAGTGDEFIATATAVGARTVSCFPTCAGTATAPGGLPMCHAARSSLTSPR